MVDRLSTDQEVVVGSRGPATVADESHTSPHHDSTAARSAKLSCVVVATVRGLKR